MPSDSVTLYIAATLNKHQIQWQVCRLYATSRNGSYRSEFARQVCMVTL